MMTPQTKSTVRNWLVALGAILPMLGWVCSAADSRYLHRSEYEAAALLDSIKNASAVHREEFNAHLLVDSLKNSIIQAKLDTLIARVTQIECGSNTVRGCR